MAFFAVNKNLSLRAFVKSDEVYLYDPDFSPEMHHYFEKLKCGERHEENAKGSSKKANDSKSKQNSVTSASISNCGKYICACNTNNLLYLWKKENNVWNLVNFRTLTRKCQKVIFTNSSSNIILADRGGDVFDYSVLKYNEAGNFLLGHISLILDIAISCDDKYLSTCDRDGKIRISCYPNSYNIVNYCLGHQEFVSSIQFVPLSEEMLLSSSGDGTMKLWQYKKNYPLMKCVTLHENAALCKHCNIGSDGKVQLDQQISDNLVLSEKQILFSVRSVKYCEKLKLFFVLFHLQSGIAVYQMLDNLDCDFKLKQFLPLDAPPLDTVFMNGEHLLVLVKHKTVVLKYFEYNAIDQTFTVIADESVPKVIEDVQAIYIDLENIDIQEDFVSLFKRMYDNNEDCSEVTQKKNKTG